MKDQFVELALKYSSNSNLIQQLWQELTGYYEGKDRHYHNLAHIQSLLQHTFEHRSLIDDFDGFCFAVFYHDSIYNVKKKDNEEKSAQLAHECLLKLNCNEKTIARCTQLISASKNHALSEDEDTRLFLDFDLSMLGACRKKYEAYTQQIRREYSFYPDLLYKPGRKKVIKHFLSKPGIYQTKTIKEKLEKQAQMNLEWELGSL